MSEHFIQAYRDSHAEYRWRLRHRNGQTLADSGEGYARRIDMLDQITKLHPGVRVDWIDSAPEAP